MDISTARSGVTRSQLRAYRRATRRRNSLWWYPNTHWCYVMLGIREMHECCADDVRQCTYSLSWAAAFEASCWKCLFGALRSASVHRAHRDAREPVRLALLLHFEREIVRNLAVSKGVSCQVITRKLSAGPPSPALNQVWTRAMARYAQFGGALPGACSITGLVRDPHGEHYRDHPELLVRCRGTRLCSRWGYRDDSLP